MFIVAHDWYIYHSVPVKRPEKFWYYSLQIGSMFFLSQMVIVAADISIGYGTIDWWRSVKDGSQVLGFRKGDLQLQPEIKGKGFWSLLKIPVVQWYIFGFFYTICNFFNLLFLSQPKKLSTASVSHYIVHLAICLGAFWVLYQYDFSNKACFWILIGTIAIVVVLWQRREWITNSGKISFTPSLGKKLKASIRIRFSGGKDALKSVNSIKIPDEISDISSEEILKKIKIVQTFLNDSGDIKAQLKNDNPGHDTFIDGLDKTKGADNYKKALADLFK